MPSVSSLSRDVEASLVRGFAQGMRETYDLAIQKSSGPFSLAALASMDHPYARRHGSPGLDPSTINVQTGTFRRRWRASLVSSGSVMRFEIVNDDPKAVYLIHGTPTMFARPIDQAIEERAGPIVEAAIERDLARTLSQTYS
jgi:hypothetical protein